MLQVDRVYVLKAFFPFLALASAITRWRSESYSLQIFLPPFTVAPGSEPTSVSRVALDWELRMTLYH